MACGFRICSETAQFVLPEQRIGQNPVLGGSIWLLHMIGIQRTKDMTFRSRHVSGIEAKDWGIVLDCVPTINWKRQWMLSWTNCVNSRPLRNAPLRAWSMRSRMQRLKLAPRSKATLMACCACRRISRRAWNPSTVSARPYSGVSKR